MESLFISNIPKCEITKIGFTVGLDTEYWSKTRTIFRNSGHKARHLPSIPSSPRSITPIKEAIQFQIASGALNLSPRGYLIGQFPGIRRISVRHDAQRQRCEFHPAKIQSLFSSPSLMNFPEGWRLLASLSKDLSTWNSSPYVCCLRLVNSQTAETLRKFWKLYSGDAYLTPSFLATYCASIKATRRTIPPEEWGPTTHMLESF
jgi:hypothetical protein